MQSGDCSLMSRRHHNEASFCKVPFLFLWTWVLCWYLDGADLSFLSHLKWANSLTPLPHSQFRTFSLWSVLDVWAEQQWVAGACLSLTSGSVLSTVCQESQGHSLCITLSPSTYNLPTLFLFWLRYQNSFPRSGFSFGYPSRLGTSILCYCYSPPWLLSKVGGFQPCSRVYLTL